MKENILNHWKKLLPSLMLVGVVLDLNTLLGFLTLGFGCWWWFIFWNRWPQHVGIAWIGHLLAPLILLSLVGLWLCLDSDPWIWKVGLVTIGLLFLGLGRFFTPSNSIQKWLYPSISGGVLVIILGSSLMVLKRQHHPGITERMIYPYLNRVHAPGWSVVQQQQAMEDVRNFFRDPTSSDRTSSLASTPMRGLALTVYQQAPYRRYRAVSQNRDFREGLFAAAREIFSQADRPIDSRAAIQIDIWNEEQRAWPMFLLRGFGSILSLVDDYFPKNHPGLAVQLAFQMEPGVDGLLIESGGKKQVILPADPIHLGWWTPRVEGKPSHWSQVFNHLKILPNSGIQVSFIKTQSWMQREATTEILPLFRGKPVSPPVDSSHIQQAIVEASNWLVRQLKEDGTFHYEYLPVTQEFPDDYNAIRHGGAVYSLFYLAQWAQTQGLLEHRKVYQQAGEKGLGWMTQKLKKMGKPVRFNEQVLCLEDQGHVTSGANAMALISYLFERDLRGSNEYEYQIHGLYRCLISMIDSKGAVHRTLEDAHNLPAVEHEPLYYPGEVLLAVAFYYQYYSKPEILSTLLTLADYRLQAFTKDKDFDHWVIQGLQKTYLMVKNPVYSQAVLAMGQEFISDQIRPEFTVFPDELGSFQRFMDVARTTRAASRMESVASAWYLARSLGIPEQGFEQALFLGARHLLEQQFRTDNTYFLPNPETVLGAIPMGIVDLHCRIDNNQHSVVGLVGALQAMQLQGK